MHFPSLGNHPHDSNAGPAHCSPLSPILEELVEICFACHCSKVYHCIRKVKWSSVPTVTIFWHNKTE